MACGGKKSGGKKGKGGIEKFPIYSMNGTEKLGRCVYMVFGCCNIGRIDGEDGWNSGVR